MLYLEDKITVAYVIGVALGDGNLSNPNGRAVRLRITCDLKYPNLITTIRNSLKTVAPNNKVGLVKKKNCNALDIYCYSNQWPEVLGWNVGKKHTQNARIPKWILENREFESACLRGLMQTDGCIYNDRGYKMVNFVNHNKYLAEDTLCMIKDLGFSPTFSAIMPTGSAKKYTIRIARNVEKFINQINLVKN